LDSEWIIAMPSIKFMVPPLNFINITIKLFKLGVLLLTLDPNYYVVVHPLYSLSVKLGVLLLTLEPNYYVVVHPLYSLSARHVFARHNISYMSHPLHPIYSLTVFLCKVRVFFS